MMGEVAPMKALIAMLVGFAILGIVILAVLNPHDRQTFNNPDLQISEVRGDRLGMDFKEYRKRHPRDCDRGGPRDCTISMESNTYAGAPASKVMLFTSAGKLAQLDYYIDESYASTIVDALKEKYGDIGCITTTKNCTWTNGKATLRYFHGTDKVHLTFLDDALNSQWLHESDEQEEQRTRENKKDQ
jgi:hypothetical protein